MLAQAAGTHYRRRLSVTVERNGSVTVLMLSEPITPKPSAETALNPGWLGLVRCQSRF
jgi:hypothetical protein